MIRRYIIQFIVLALISISSQSCGTKSTEASTKVVSAPYFSRPSGTYHMMLTVSLHSQTPGAGFRYTTDGSDPSQGSEVYSEPITISESTVLRAIAFREGFSDSAVSHAQYILEAGPPPNSMALVQGGAFHNGTSTVNISSFYIDKHEVSQQRYQSIMGINPSYFSESPSLPVEMVSWFDAVEFCNLLSIREMLNPCYHYGDFGTNPKKWPSNWRSSDKSRVFISCDWSANGYRMPTEMEWMYAAKGGILSQAFVYSGSNSIDEVAWYEDNSSESTHVIGLKLSNELGLYDMSGNVWEWCWDIFDNYPDGEQTDPTGPDIGSRRVLRGGSWQVVPGSCGVASRGSSGPGSLFPSFGFRCVRRWTAS